MAYYSNKEIASVVEPNSITLANNPNFVVFSSKGDKDRDQKMRAVIEIKETTFGADFDGSQTAIDKLETLAQELLYFEITGSNASVDTYSFQGTYDRIKVDSKTFYVAREGETLDGNVLSKDEALAITASNLKECFMQNSFLKNNFEITIFDLEVNQNVVKPGHQIEILSKGIGSLYDFSIVHGKRHVSGKAPNHIITVDITGFTDEMIKLDIISYFYTLPITGTIVSPTLKGAFFDEKVDQKKVIVVYRPQETGLSWDECNKKTLASLAVFLSNYFPFFQIFNVVLNTKKGYIELSYGEFAEVFFPYEISFSSDFGLFSKLPEEEYSFITSSVSVSSSSDTIDYGTGEYQIELDVYTDHEVLPGSKDSLNYVGKYLTTLSKSYFGKPLWFDLSTLLSKKVNYSPAFLSELELKPEDEKFQLWSNAETMTNYRFIAKRTDGKINQPFYYSSPLYILNGYDYTLNPSTLGVDDAGNSYSIDFSQDFYMREFTKIKPLTNRFTRTHIKGQKQYFNFIHNYRWTTLRVGGADNLVPSLGLRYKLYTQMGGFIGEYTSKGQEESDFSQVNTGLLQLDQYLPIYNGKTVGRIDVYLCRWHKSTFLGLNESEVIISTPLSFRILPEDINEVNDFAFLNRLGGWDTMNFGGGFSSEFKTAGSTIYKTLQPDPNLRTEIESVAMKSVQEQKVVQTSPITGDIVDWLREMSASRAVYELKTKRYIIVDDMTLKYNTTDDLYQVEMKYHYTDTYNTQIK